MALKFSNFARAKVATPPTGTGGLAFTVEAGKGALYPVMAPGDYFYGVFTNALKTSYEVVKIIGRTGDAFTVDPVGRGFDGTTAQTWLANDLFLLPPTKRMFEDLFSSAFLALVGLVPAADKIAYFTGAAAAALTNFTATARSICALVFLAKGDLISGGGVDTGVVTSVGPDGYSLRAQASSPGGIAWQPHGLPPGIPLPYLGTTAPPGFVLGTGSIGDATSGATQRANADTFPLYSVLWNSCADTQAPVSGGRGATAAADFAVHKTITIPDYRGRGFIGLDNMGGVAANITTLAVSGMDATKMGFTGGDQRSQLHAHGVTENPHVHTEKAATGATGLFALNGGLADINSSTSTINTGGAVTGLTVNPSGAGNSQNISPNVASNIIITL